MAGQDRPRWEIYQEIQAIRPESERNHPAAQRTTYKQISNTTATWQYIV